MSDGKKSGVDKLLNLKELREFFDGVKDLIDPAKDLHEACENYKKDPSADNAKLVRDADKGLLDKLIEIVSQFLPSDPFADPSGEAVKAIRDIITKDRGLDEIVEWEERNYEQLNKRQPVRKDVDVACHSFFRDAKTPPRRDPLAIDLDADGIETSTATILFDHNNDGTNRLRKYPTGTASLLTQGLVFR